MSAQGQLRNAAATFVKSALRPRTDLNREKADLGQGMSAKRPITEVAGRLWHFRLVPIGDIGGPQIALSILPKLAHFYAATADNPHRSRGAVLLWCSHTFTGDVVTVSNQPKNAARGDKSHRMTHPISATQPIAWKREQYRF